MKCPACNGEKKKCRVCLGTGEEKSDWTDLECEKLGYLIAHDIINGAIKLGYHLDKTTESNIERVNTVLKRVKNSLWVKSRKKE